jgi:hypothetical protein
MKSPTRLWLRRVRITDDPAGDLIGDMRQQMLSGFELPRVFANIGAMRAYLRDRGASSQALDAVPEVWSRYRRWLNYHGGAIRRIWAPEKESMMSKRRDKSAFHIAS